MKRKNRDIAVAQNILREINDVDDFLRGISEADFLQSRLLQKATVMSLLNIGEQTKLFTDALEEAMAWMPWQDMRSARNLAAHTYDALDMDDVWETYQSDLPELRRQMNWILTELQNGWDPQKEAPRR